MTNSQQRCVFVGNIPYDATEAQLTQICEEVGPVVSFRLVLDRETSKPKGYGFCEYRDEETAASARRNLQGYEINGRQLRVDYAENDKGTDRNREQGRGGPGLASIYDNQKQSTATFSGDPSHNHPIGIAAAAAAASIMATALGEPQTSINDQSQVFSNARNNATGIHDPLTLHLASMPKKQLLEFLYEMKALAKQNKQQAHQILTMHPSLTKAIFQAQIILGMITPQMASNFKNDIQTQTSQQVYQAPTGQTQTQSGLVDHEQILQRSPPHNVPLQHLLSSSEDLNQTKPLLNKQGPNIQQLSQSLNLPVQHTLTSQPLPSQSQPLSIQPGFGKLYNQTLSQQSRQPYPSSGHNPLFKPSGISHQRNSPPPVQAAAGNANAAILAANMEFGRSGTVNNHLLRDPGFGSENLLLGARGSSFSQVPGSRASDVPWVPTAQSKGPVVSKGPYGIEDRISRNYISLVQNGEIGPLPTDISVTPVIHSHAVSQSIAAGIEQMQQSISEEAQFTPELQSVLLHQVMSLTQEQINSLPPDQQQQVFQVQQLAQMYQGGSSS